MHSTDNITNNQQRSLRSRKAPFKAIHFEDGTHREPIWDCELAKEEQGSDTTTVSDPPAKRPRVALRTQALRHNQQYPQGGAPQRLSSVCPVPLPPLYGCCCNLQFDIPQDELGTRSIESQTSATPFNYNSKFVCIFCLHPKAWVPEATRVRLAGGSETVVVSLPCSSLANSQFQMGSRWVPSSKWIALTGALRDRRLRCWLLVMLSVECIALQDEEAEAILGNRERT